MKELLFISSILFVFHAYIGYPLSLFLLSLFCKKRVKKSPVSPSVTVIIPVHNEEKVIDNKLQNTLNLNYPKDLLNILVVSDGSTDRTNDIVRSFASRGIGLLAIPEHHGKGYAETRAVEQASGDILVFTDADTYEDVDALKEAISNFSDPDIGCVSGSDYISPDGGLASGEGYYISYEMLVRSLESEVNSVVGASGQFYAIRRCLGKDYAKDALTDGDFKASLVAVKNGLRAVSDPAVRIYYTEILNRKDEYARRVRTIVRGISNIFRNAGFFNVFRYGLFSYQFFCHKLLRWLVPFFLCAAFFANIAILTEHYEFMFLFVAQAVFYGLGIYGWLRKSPRSIFLTRIATFFFVSNLMIAIGWFNYFTGNRMVTWVPSRTKR